MLRDMFDALSWRQELAFALVGSPLWLLFRVSAAPPANPRSSAFNTLWHGCRRRQRPTAPVHQRQRPVIEPSRQFEQLLLDARRNGTSEERAPWVMPARRGHCVICQDADATRVFTACGHLCMCAACGDGLVVRSQLDPPQNVHLCCPVCRKDGMTNLPLIDATLLEQMQSLSPEDAARWEETQFGPPGARDPETIQAYNIYTHVRDGMLRQIHAQRMINPNAADE